MNDLMEKARTGRTDALAGRQDKTDDIVSVVVPIAEFKSSRGTEAMAFISTRAQVANSTWLH